MPSAERRSAALLAVLAATLAGCSTSDEPELPVACQTTAGAVERALERAPGPVTLDGTPISECFTRGGQQGEIQTVGFAFTEAASNLAREAEERPDGDAAVELGYLLGAVRRGAAGTQGIHDELVRRLEQELGGVDTRSEAFVEGERAGRESG